MAQRGLLLSWAVIPFILGLAFITSFFISGLNISAIHKKTTSTAATAAIQPQTSKIKVYIADLPRDFNYGLLQEYWSQKDNRASSDDFEALRPSMLAKMEYAPYPMNPLIRQYSAEYWILGDLLGGSGYESSVAQKAWSFKQSDVVFVPFFATLSAEMQLDRGKGRFRHKKMDNEDYARQRKVVDLVKGSSAWQRSGGRDHVFVITDPVALWHVREEISPAILLVVDFGGWYREDSKNKDSETSGIIHHTQVSLLKDVIIPYTHLLPTLHLSKSHHRPTLLYFKGAKHRHRGGLVREKLWDLLENEPGVVMEEGFPNSTGRDQAIKGMHNAEFCLHPAGDTPTSCRLFDAIASLCIPVVVSDNIELPFEGMIDYTTFSVFVSVQDALQPKWLINKLRGIGKKQRDIMRKEIAKVQHIFEFDSGHLGGIGPAVKNGAVNHIWTKVLQKLPAIKETIVRERRKPNATTIPLRCLCT